MKIINLEFQNINSLKGKWFINFDHKDYHENHDIFVIHGPTGAGKTSILDAITLALYGRTPRQNTINSQNAGNELLTRGTNICYSKVTFECDGSIYTSSFLQRKSNRRNEEKLLKIEYCINTEDGLELISNTRKEHAANIENIIKLNYEQFSRSIMLAQGEFNTFLKSKSEDRAAILEKLTGTTKYKKIAILINERYTNKKEAYEYIKEEKAEIESKLLTKNEEEIILNKITQEKKELEKLNKEKDKITKLLDWYETVDELKEKKNSCLSKLNNIKIEETNFKPKIALLEKAQSASNCIENYTKFDKQRNLYNKNLLESDKLKIKLDNDKLEYKNINLLYSKKNKSLNNLQEKYKELTPIIKETKEIDSHLLQLNEQYDDYIDEKKSIDDEFKGTEKTLNNNKNELKIIKCKITNLKNYKKEHEKDEKLKSILPKIETIYLDIPKLQTKIRTCNENLQDLIQEKNDLLEEKEYNLKKSKELKDKIKNFISKKYMTITMELQKLLRDNKPCPVCGSLNHPLNKKIKNNKKNIVIEDLNMLQKKLDESLNNLSQINIEINKIENKIKNNKQIIQENKNEITKKINTINSLLKNWNSNITEKNIQITLKKLDKEIEKFNKNEDELRDNKEQELIITANISNSQKNIINIKKKINTLNNKINNIKDKITSLSEKRKELFGNKDVELFENEINKDLEKLNKEVKKIKEDEEQKKDIYKEKETLYHKLLSESKELKNDYELYRNEFFKILKENNFQDEDEFLKSKLTKNECKNIEIEKNRINKELQILNTKYNDAVDAYTKCLNKYVNVDTKYVLQVKKENIKNNIDKANNNFMNLNMKIKLNDDYKKKSSEISDKYISISKEYYKLKQMKEWVGKKDGSDFSVFVQSLAFNSLLKYSNKYLYGITGRYYLGQKNETDLDFIIFDNNYIEPRSITNLSGGEQFIVSLSLALGIAKYASHTVKVDSLFLDEGFGTLSGKLLIESVNALKQLQKDGKMLGIITHVQNVINEIDQKIEVIPQAGGYSILKGAGIEKLD